jgi:hypothetical protein
MDLGGRPFFLNAWGKKFWKHLVAVLFDERFFGQRLLDLNAWDAFFPAFNSAIFFVCRIYVFAVFAPGRKS